MHAAQHCLSCSDLGACWSQSFADVADVIFAQQLASSTCGTAASAGRMASGIETQSARLKTNRKAVCIRGHLTALAILFQRRRSIPSSPFYSGVGTSVEAKREFA